jgi:hypothetical protein
MRLAIDQKDISPPPHEGVRRHVGSKRQDPLAVHENVVEGEHLLSVDGRIQPSVR